MCHDHTEAIFVTCLHQVCTVCVMNSLQPTPKIALALMWPHIYLRERYPHPYYHCSESYRSQLYPRPVHHPACLYLFFSVRHLKGKFSRFITGRALKLKTTNIVTFPLSSSSHPPFSHFLMQSLFTVYLLSPAPFPYYYKFHRLLYEHNTISLRRYFSAH